MAGIKLRLGEEKGNYIITKLEVMKKAEKTELLSLCDIAGRKARLCGCRNVCVALVDVAEELKTGESGTKK